jgi:menaquinone-specific isochorismate synthase
MSPTLIHTTDNPITLTALDRLLRTKREYPCEIAFKLGGISPFRWLAVQPSATKLVWTDREPRTTVAGWGLAGDVIRQSDETTSSVLQRCREMLGNNSSLRMYGGFGFDDSRPTGDEWSAFGSGRFWLPRVTYDGRHLRLLIRDPQDIEEGRTALANCLTQAVSSLRPMPMCVTWRDDPGKDEWQNLLQECGRLFAAEILEKIVLVRRRELTLERPVCPFDLLSRMNQPDCQSYAFGFQPNEQSSFLGISPERLFARQGNDFQSEVVAGTRPRGADADADRQLAAELRSSAKEQLEHDIVRKSICQRLHRFVDDLQVDACARLLALPSMQHLYSSVRGELKPGVDDGTLIDRLHPTPALGGYPTENALAEIQRLERFDRGWYGAPVGWVSRDAAEFAVGIRSALMTSQRVYLYSGAGIVPGSTAEGEWSELNQKIRDFLQVLHGDERPTEWRPA